MLIIYLHFRKPKMDAVKRSTFCIFNINLILIYYLFIIHFQANTHFYRNKIFLSHVNLSITGSCIRWPLIFLILYYI